MKVTVTFSIPYEKENYEKEPGVYMTEEEAAKFEENLLKHEQIGIEDLLDIAVENSIKVEITV